MHHRPFCRGHPSPGSAVPPQLRCCASRSARCSSSHSSSSSHSADAAGRAASCSAAGSGGASASSSPPRRLILLRHADSEAAGSVRDHDRPISAQGRQEAASIARRLAAAGWLPDVILASNSKRTRDTLYAMTEVVGQLAEADVHLLGSLYTVAALDGQTRSHLEECIRGIAGDGGSTSTVMCVGHNKGWEEAASAFANQSVRLNTACAALLESLSLGGSWEEVTAPDAGWTLVQVLTP